LGLIAFLAIDDDEGNHQEQVGELIKQTAASIDDLALKMLFVTVQQNNLEVCIEYAMNRSVVHSICCCFNLSLYCRNIFKDVSTVVYFHLNYKDMSAQMNKEGLDLQAACWFAHCYFEVCQSNTFSGAVTEVEKNYVRVHFC
jgi:hypothetical protein